LFIVYKNKNKSLCLYRARVKITLLFSLKVDAYINEFFSFFSFFAVLILLCVRNLSVFKKKKQKMQKQRNIV